MSNAFSFRPPTELQAQPQQVGAALMGGGGMMQQAPPADPDAELRREGGRLMTTAQTTDGDAAVLSAIGEALTRQGGGYTTNVAGAAFKDRARISRDLQRLGLSATEAELLGLTGGF